MNRITGLTLSLLLILCCQSFGQLPEKAEDVSPLLTGEYFPDVEVTNREGQSISILEVIKEEPSVILFYRGGWCPYCNHHLADIGEIEEQIIQAGFQILAISPDGLEQLAKTGKKNQLNYRLLSDGSGALAKAIGIAFKAPDRYQNRLIDFSDGKNDGYLPVPAVFVVDKSGEILFEYINPNFRQRMSAKLLTAVLGAFEIEK